MTEVTERETRETMQFRALGWEVTVPAGTYFIGDPCYTVDDHSQWLELLNSCGFFDASPVGTIGVIGGGQQVLAFGTRWGDGTYRDQDGTQYSVDAGLLGLVPEAVFTAQRNYPDLRELGRIVTFGEPVTCTDDKSGLLVFGSVKIDTDPQYEEGEDGQ